MSTQYSDNYQCFLFFFVGLFCCMFDAGLMALALAHKKLLAFWNKVLPFTVDIHSGRFLAGRSFTDNMKVLDQIETYKEKQSISYHHQRHTPFGHNHREYQQQSPNDLAFSLDSLTVQSQESMHHPTTSNTTTSSSSSSQMMKITQEWKLLNNQVHGSLTPQLKNELFNTTQNTTTNTVQQHIQLIIQSIHSFFSSYNIDLTNADINIGGGGADNSSVMMTMGQVMNQTLAQNTIPLLNHLLTCYIHSYHHHPFATVPQQQTTLIMSPTSTSTSTCTSIQPLSHHSHHNSHNNTNHTNNNNNDDDDEDAKSPLSSFMKSNFLPHHSHHHHPTYHHNHTSSYSHNHSNNSSMSNMVMMDDDDDVLKDVSSVMMIGGWKEACLRYGMCLVLLLLLFVLYYYV